MLLFCDRKVLSADLNAIHQLEILTWCTAVCQSGSRLLKFPAPHVTIVNTANGDVGCLLGTLDVELGTLNNVTCTVRDTVWLSVLYLLVLHFFVLRNRSCPSNVQYYATLQW